MEPPPKPTKPPVKPAKPTMPQMPPRPTKPGDRPLPNPSKTGGSPSRRSFRAPKINKNDESLSVSAITDQKLPPLPGASGNKPLPLARPKLPELKPPLNISTQDPVLNRSVSSIDLPSPRKKDLPTFKPPHPPTKTNSGNIVHKPTPIPGRRELPTPGNRELISPRRELPTPEQKEPTVPSIPIRREVPVRPTKEIVSPRREVPTLPIKTPSLKELPPRREVPTPPTKEIVSPRRAVPTPPPKENSDNSLTPPTKQAPTPPAKKSPAVPPKSKQTPPPKPGPKPSVPAKPSIPDKPLIKSNTGSLSSDPSKKRVSSRPDLENVLQLRLSGNNGPPSGPPATPPDGPPQEPCPTPPESKRKSKLLRPKSSKKKASKVYGTLPRLGSKEKKGKDKDKDSKDNEPPNLEVSATPTISDPVDTPVSETAGKWKRGAEAEAILKLLSETAESMKEEEKKASSSDRPSQPLQIVPDAIDAESIMKILGLEEPGIQLPKHKEGDEKALDPTSELQLTERNFIADLGLLHQTFVKPCRENHVLPSSVIDSISLNLERLISLHREFYKNFLVDSSMKGITTTFTDDIIFELERLYTVYMGHYESALALFYEKRDSTANFRKYLKQREEMTDKSIPNLLVTPVQRVCKYELMLASIKKSVLKQAEDPNDKQLLSDAEALQKTIDALNEALVNVDRRRAAADNWDKITHLESSLQLSEPISKMGRIIILDTDTSIKLREQEHVFKIVLFNDLLIRTKQLKKNSKARLLDSIPLSQIQVIDIKKPTPPSKPGEPERYSFYLVPLDPLLDLWTVHFNDLDTKTKWFNELQEKTQSLTRFAEDFGIPNDKKETILAADGGKWPQEFVEACRLYITENYLCILWKLFGIVERELVPFNYVTSVQRTTFGKEPAIKLLVSNWKQDYTFTNLQNIDNIESILKERLQAAKSANTKSALRRTYVQQEQNPFILTPYEWKSIWKHGKTCSFTPKQEIIREHEKCRSLFELKRGTVRVHSNPPKIISTSGTIFGIAGFLNTGYGPVTITAEGDVTVVELQKEALVGNCDGDMLMKFFATLAKNIATE